MRDYVKFIASLVLFGSNGVMAAHIALSSASIVFYRTLIGAIALGLLFSVLRNHANTIRNKRELAYVIASGASMGLSWLFLYEAYRLVGVGVSSMAYYCAPIMVMALSPVIFKERLTPPIVVTFGVVFIGAFLINGDNFNDSASAFGMICAWASAICHAAMVIFSKLADKIDGIESSLIQLVVSFAVAALFLILTSGIEASIPLESIGWILMLGVVNTGIGCYLYFSSFGGLSAQTVAILGYLEPLSAVFCAFLFLDETMQWVQVLGSVLIVCGAFAGTMLVRRNGKFPMERIKR